MMTLLLRLELLGMAAGAAIGSDERGRFGTQRIGRTELVRFCKLSFGGGEISLHEKCTTEQPRSLGVVT